jgi:hypothetical protein
MNCGIQEVIKRKLKKNEQFRVVGSKFKLSYFLLTFYRIKFYFESKFGEAQIVFDDLKETKLPQVYCSMIKGMAKVIHFIKIYSLTIAN